jgi:cation transport regulator ChaC
MTLLFQYGSNCDNTRLNDPERLGGAAINPRLAQTVGEYDIAFNVFSQGNGCAANNLTAAPGRHAWGVLYDISDDRLTGKGAVGRKTMAQIEGPRYEPRTITVRTADGQGIDATTFIVKKDAERTGLWTSKEYVGHIVTGLLRNGAPPDYVEHVITIAIENNERASERADEEARRITTLRAS